MIGRIFRAAIKLVVGLVLAMLALIVLYRWVDPWVTPLMLIRLPQEGRIDRHDVSLRAISPELEHAVIASENNPFCRHRGIDWGAVGDAVEQYDAEGHSRGASTIDMQVARNLFLWPGGGFARKAIEAGIALTIDALWSKRRILAVYLNVIEWGHGLYGADAAARAYFHVPASRLSRYQAVLLAAVLPNPRRWSPARPTSYIAARAAAIAARVPTLDGYYDCLR